MKKFIIVVLVSLKAVWVFGQNPEIKTDLPTVIPPSPTVAALMKFEEIPVSNYTGVPDISIPLFSSSTRSKDINLDISLKYHPAGTAVDQKASDVGLGWSLFAGGTISRTVRSIPDEMFLQVNRSDNGKVGIYQTPENGKTNNYYTLVKLIEDKVTLNSSQLELKKEFLYEAQEKGKYDTEHDLWQFNFMGKSGRFFIKKNLSTGQLEVKPLDDYNIKIVNQYGTTQNAFEPIGFIIYDDKGYKYYFDIIENAETNGFSDSYFEGLAISTSFSKVIQFKSSFHISKILDNNDKVLIDFEYDTRITKEMEINGFQKSSQAKFDTRFYLTPDGGDISATCVTKLEPTISNRGDFKRVYAKKLLAINVIGISKINFNFVQGREDSKMHRPDSVYVLKSVVIKDWGNRNIKKFQLEHSYSDLIITKRLMLNGIKTFDKDNISFTDYDFFYYDQLENGVSLTEDAWGYFTKSASCEAIETSPKYSTLDLLRKIKYPTGGSVAFDFEPNQYSYIGAYPAEDYEINNNFNNNKSNIFTSQTLNYKFDGLNQSTIILPPVTSNQLLKISTSISYDEGQNYKFLVLQKNNVFYKGFVCPNECPNCKTEVLLEPGNQYKFVYSLADSNYKNDIENVEIEYINIVSSNIYKKYFIGGGNRIKRISYFQKNIDQYYDDQLGTYVTSELPEKEKNYNYNFFNDPNRSSGSLAYYKPIYSYYYQTIPCVECKEIPDSLELDYEVSTSYNNLQQRKTQGSDVGYKNVTVFETNLGRTEYTFTSPIDFSMSEPYAPGYPFVDLPPDIDYLRGQNISEKTYNKNGLIVNETISTFQTDAFTQTSGLQLRYSNGPKNGRKNGSAISYKYRTYLDYKNYVLKCGQKFGDPNYTGPPNNTGPYEYGPLERNPPQARCFCYSGEPDEFIIALLKTESYGWAKLTAKTAKNYFYTGSTPNIVESTETYTYNPLNKKIASQTTTNSNTSELLKSDFTYHTGNSTFSQNRISEIEKVDTYRNSDLLSSTKIVYSTAFPGNASQLPQIIQTATTGQPFENRLKYNAYDEFGNPLEVQQEGGVTIAYIWGYNKTQPIAKIENATYAAVQSQVANLQTLSDTGTEANLLTALNTLRTSLPNAMVTTYIYKPLIGISSMTDPKGYKMTYEYDEFNRLKQVKDQDGNVLSENQYNYKQ